MRLYGFFWCPYLRLSLYFFANTSQEKDTTFSLSPSMEKVPLVFLEIHGFLVVISKKYAFADSCQTKALFSYSS